MGSGRQAQADNLRTTRAHGAHDEDVCKGGKHVREDHDDVMTCGKEREISICGLGRMRTIRTPKTPPQHTAWKDA